MPRQQRGNLACVIQLYTQDPKAFVHIRRPGLDMACGILHRLKGNPAMSWYIATALALAYAIAWLLLRIAIEEFFSGPSWELSQDAYYGSIWLAIASMVISLIVGLISLRSSEHRRTKQLAGCFFWLQWTILLFVLSQLAFAEESLLKWLRLELPWCIYGAASVGGFLYLALRSRLPMVEPKTLLGRQMAARDVKRSTRRHGGPGGDGEEPPCAE